MTDRLAVTYSPAKHTPTPLQSHSPGCIGSHPRQTIIPALTLDSAYTCIQLTKGALTIAKNFPKLNLTAFPNLGFNKLA